MDSDGFRRILMDSDGILMDSDGERVISRERVIRELLESYERVIRELLESY